VKGWTAPVLLFGFAFLATRLLLLVHGYAVNVLYWDQWDFFEALFDEVSWWETFRWQHGPHRQGVGFVLARAVAWISAWDTRADAFLSAVLVVAAAGGLLWLRRRLLGPLGAGDLAIPLIALTPAQYGIFVHTVNASQAAAPLLLVAAYALALSIERPAPRTGTLLVLNFLLIHTGFGLFAGILTPCLFAVEAARAGPGRRARPATALAVSLLSAVAFFAGYEFDPASDAFRFSPQDATRVPRFAALMLANSLGIKGTGWLATALGLLPLVAGLAIAGVRGRRITQGRDDATDRGVAFLAAFSLLFCLGAAAGRVHLGLGMAQSSRYVPLTAPLLVAIALHAASLPRSRSRSWIRTFLVVALVAASFPMRSDESRFMRHLHSGKERWVEVYRQTHDVAAADRAAGLRIYPWEPERTDLRRKLEWLEANEKNLFKP
jgi:hypothetical protein